MSYLDGFQVAKACNHILFFTEEKHFWTILTACTIAQSPVSEQVKLATVQQKKKKNR